MHDAGWGGAETGAEAWIGMFNCFFKIQTVDQASCQQAVAHDYDCAQRIIKHSRLVKTKKVETY